MTDGRAMPNADVLGHRARQPPLRLVGLAEPLGPLRPGGDGGVTWAASAAGSAIAGPAAPPVATTAAAREATAASTACDSAHWRTRAGSAVKAARVSGLGAGIGHPVRCASTASSAQSRTQPTASSARCAARMSRSVQGRAWHSAPQVTERGCTTVRASLVSEGESNFTFNAIFYGCQDREVHPVGEDRRPSRRQGHQVAGLGRGGVHRRADRLAVVGGGEAVDDLDRGVLYHVRYQPGRDLLGDDQPLPVRADLRQQAGEHLDRVPGRAAPARLVGGPGPAEQPVRLLDHGQMAQ